MLLWCCRNITILLVVLVKAKWTESSNSHRLIVVIELIYESAYLVNCGLRMLSINNLAGNHIVLRDRPLKDSNLACCTSMILLYMSLIFTQFQFQCGM